MNTPLFPLPPQPTRALLRQAHDALSGLAALNIPGAADELGAVDALTRLLYPRRSKGSPLPASRPQRPMGKKAKRTRPITSADCWGRCWACNGRKGSVSKDGSFCTLCVVCRGRGRCIIAASETVILGDAPTRQRDLGERWWLNTSDPKHATPVTLDKAARLLDIGERLLPLDQPEDPEAKPIRIAASKSKLVLRGDFAQQYGVSETPAHRARMHTRGYVGMSDLTGPLIDDYEWHFHGADSDVSAEREAEAMARLAAFAEPVFTNPLRGRRLLGSHRDGDNLRPGGQRRSRMSDRVRKYQRQFDKEHGVAATPALSDAKLLDAAAELLKSMGISIPAAMQMQAEPIKENPLIAEARRRGDLPPDDGVVFQPLSADELTAVPTFGEHKGQPGRVGMQMRGCLRRDGTFTWENGLRVDFPDGTFEVFHADDLCFA